MVVQTACTGRVQLKAGGHRARAERTENMPLMLLTLDVSKPSGWLNVDALCRVEKRSCEAGRGAGREARGGCWCGGGASGMHGDGPTESWGPGHAWSARRTSSTCL